MKRLSDSMLVAMAGFFVTGLGILCLRQLSAFAGNSILVTSTIIAASMLGLAYGCNRYDVHVVDKQNLITKKIFIAMLFAGIGLSYNFIFLFFTSLEKYINSSIILLFYSALIITPLMYHLGQVIVTTTIFNVLSISAIGGFCAAVLTAPVLMHFIGVEITLLINCLLLGLAALLSLNNKKAVVINDIVIILIAIPTIFVLNNTGLTLGTPYSNEYSNYAVIKNYKIDDNRLGTVFAINNSPSAFAAIHSQTGFDYVETIKDILFKQLKLTNKTILVLGAGAFSISASSTHDNKFLYVDIDPNIKKIVEEYKISKVNGEFIASDARTFLRKNINKFAVVISDVYSHKTTIPQHLITKEYFELVAQAVENNGLAIFNIIINPFLKDAHSAKIDNTIKSVFDFCTTTVLDYSHAETNVLYVCNLYKAQKTNTIYTDDNST